MFCMIIKDLRHYIVTYFKLRLNNQNKLYYLNLQVLN